MAFGRGGVLAHTRYHSYKLHGLDAILAQDHIAPNLCCSPRGLVLNGPRSGGYYHSSVAVRKQHWIALHSTGILGYLILQSDTKVVAERYTFITLHCEPLY